LSKQCDIDIRNKSGAFRSSSIGAGNHPTIQYRRRRQRFARHLGIWFVRDVAGASTDPVPLTVDWKMFARLNFVFGFGRQPMHGMKIGTILMESNLGGKASAYLGSVAIDESEKTRAKNLRAYIGRR